MQITIAHSQSNFAKLQGWLRDFYLKEARGKKSVYTSPIQAERQLLSRLATSCSAPFGAIEAPTLIDTPYYTQMLK